MPSLPLPACRLAWLLLLLVTAGVGAVHIPAHLEGLPPHRIAPDATSEAIFATLTHEREVPQQLAAEMAPLPPDRPVLILRPRENLFAVLPSLMLAYELAPRPSVVREAELTDTEATAAELRRVFGAIFFVGQKPPAVFPVTREFGGWIFFAPLTAEKP